MEKKRVLKRFLSFFMCFIVAFTFVTPAFAADGDVQHKGTVDNITEGLAGEITDEGFLIYIAEALTLDWTAKDEAVGRYQDGWWVGLKMKAPKTLDAQTLKDAKYYNGNPENWGEAKSFWEDKHSADTDPVQYLNFWLPVTADYIEKAKQENTTVNYYYLFDWDGDADEVATQQVTLSLDIDKLALVHSAGHSEKITVEALEPTCLTGGNTAEIICEICGLVLEEKEDIDALGHDFSEAIIDDTHFKASGEQEGSFVYYYNCSRCDVMGGEENTYTVNEGDLTFPKADFEIITEGLAFNGEILTNESTLTLDWAKADTSIGRYADGWWIGFKVLAPEGMTEEQLKNVQYASTGNSGIRYDGQSFWENKDSTEGAQRHYMTLWMRVTPEIIETAKAQQKNLTWLFEFDWDNNGYAVTNQKLTATFDISKLTLIHSEGHTKVLDSAYEAPDCLNKGYTEASHCEVCGLLISEREEIDALGHDFSEEIHDEAHLVKRATCAHLDLYRYSCVRCDVMSENTYEFGGTLLEHVKVRRIEAAYLVSKADCLNSAVYYMGCQNCDTVFTDDPTYTDGTPLYHKFTKEVVVKKATTKAEGIINFYCADCGESDNQPIPIAKLSTKAELSGTSFVYTGKAITPSITVKDVDGMPLEKGIDYTVSYVDNNAPGTGKLVLTLINKYSGKYTFNFKIDIGKPAKVSYVANASAVKISWSEVAGAAGYKVYYKAASGWKALGNTTKLSATFKNLPSGTRYTFAVKAAIRKDGKVIWSNSYTTIEASTAPAAPSKVVAAQNTSAIKLTWAASKGATGYRIYYNTANGWKACAQTASTSHTFTKLPSGTSYVFAVRPYVQTANGSVWGDYITFVTATKPATPVAKAVSNSSENITVTWTKVQGASGYQVYYKTSTGSYTLIKNVGSNVTSLTDSDYTSGKTYQIAVRAYKAVSGGYVYGGYNPVSVTVK